MSLGHRIHRCDFEPLFRNNPVFCAKSQRRLPAEPYGSLANDLFATCKLKFLLSLPNRHIVDHKVACCVGASHRRDPANAITCRIRFIFDLLGDARLFGWHFRTFWLGVVRFTYQLCSNCRGRAGDQRYFAWTDGGSPYFARSQCLPPAHRPLA